MDNRGSALRHFPRLLHRLLANSRNRKEPLHTSPNPQKLPRPLRLDTNNNHRLDASEVTTAYTLGLSVLSQATATQVLNLLTDAHGNTVAVQNAKTTPTASSILQRYHYSAFGNDLGLPSSPLTAYRYAGQFIDSTTGLSFNRARWYDPAEGRFLTSDPFSGDVNDPLSLNKYLYGNGNPINETDPSGKFSLVEIVIDLGFEDSFEGINEARVTGEGAAEIMKTLVTVILIDIGFTVSRMRSLNVGWKAFAEAYYAYEEQQFLSNYQGAKEIELAPKVGKLADYLGGLARGAEVLDENDVDYDPTSFLKIGSSSVLATTFIPLTGSRTGDNYLSFASASAQDIAAFAEQLWLTHDWASAAMGLGQQAARRLGIVLGSFGNQLGWTWHHSELLGVMQYLQADAHAESHTGGVSLWKILNDESSYAN